MVGFLQSLPIQAVLLALSFSNDKKEATNDDLFKQIIGAQTDISMAKCGLPP